MRGVDLHYELVGDGEPLVLVHGLGSSGRDWEKQTPRFAAEYQVVLPDLRGHGRSAKPPGPYSIAGFAADVAALLRRLELAPAHVVGVSLGGMVALELALSEPELVRRLVLINAPLDARLDTLARKWTFWSRWLIVALLGVSALAQVLARKLFPKPEQEGLRRVFIERWRENDQRPYLASLRAIKGWSAVDRLPGVACPTLVIAAEHDYTPTQRQRELAAAIPGATFELIQDARHAVPVEKPEEVNALVARFLSDAG